MGGPVCLLNRRPQGHRRSSRLLSARIFDNLHYGQVAEQRKAPDCNSGSGHQTTMVRIHPCPPLMLEWRNRETCAVEGRIVASSNLAPSTNGRLAQFWQTRWSQEPVVPGSNPGPATKFQASGETAYAARSKRAVFGHCGFDSHLAYQVAPRLPMVRRTVSKAVARGSNPCRGANAPERKEEERPDCNPGISRFDAGPVLQFSRGGHGQMVAQRSRKPPSPGT